MKSNSQGGATLWFTGLSGAGKSTLAEMFKNYIEDNAGIKCVNLDGDKLRKGLNADLKFSQEDRTQNIRRVSEIAKLLNSQGNIVVVSCISPYSKDREKAKKIHKEQNLPFYEIYICSSLEQCQLRDVKGLYKLARAGKIPKFTGISDKYEIPQDPSLKILTDQESKENSLLKLVDYLKLQGIFKCNKDKIYDYIDYQANIEDLNTLQVIQQGWTKVNNLMNYEQIIECLQFKTVHIQNLQIFQPVPLFILCGEQIVEKAQKCQNKINIKIRNIKGRQIAVLQDVTFQKARKQELICKMLGTGSERHPYASSLIKRGGYIISGKKLHFKTIDILFEDGLDYLRLSAQQIKTKIQRLNGDCTFAFQLRNPLHNGHLYLLRQARTKLLEKGYHNPILLLHPCGGWTKDDDIPLKIRIQQHLQLLQTSQDFNENQYILAIWPSQMFYAGPRQVLWHFSSRQNSGVNFMIVGRDPAGIKHPDNSNIDLYDIYDGQRILNMASKKKLLNMDIIPFRQISWNKKKQKLQQVDSQKIGDYQIISGSQMRELGRKNQSVPEWFMNANSWRILKQFYNKMQQ